MEKHKNILYSTEDCWGITYFFKRGYIQVTDNTNIPESEMWIARFYYSDKRGNIFLKFKEGRELKIDINSSINFFSDEYLVLIKNEIESMDKKSCEFKFMYSELEKAVLKK